MKLSIVGVSKQLNTAFAWDEKQDVLYLLPRSFLVCSSPLWEILLLFAVGFLEIFLAVFAFSRGISGLITFTAIVMISAGEYGLHCLLEKQKCRRAKTGLRLKPDQLSLDQLRDVKTSINTCSYYRVTNPYRLVGLLPLSAFALIYAIVLLVRVNPVWTALLVFAVVCLQLGLYGIYHNRCEAAWLRCSVHLNELFLKKNREYRDSVIEKEVEEKYGFLDPYL